MHVERTVERLADAGSTPAASTIQTMQLQIAIDTDEKRPWSFPPECAKTHKRKLRTADYALLHDDGFAIERKSLDDFVGTISTGYARFCRELDRMTAAGFPARVVIVEGSWAQVIDHEYEHPQVMPRFVLSRVAEFALDGVHVMFADNAHYAAFLAWRILKARWNQLSESVWAVTGERMAIDTIGNADAMERELWPDTKA